jgi:hypothetical protein
VKVHPYTPAADEAWDALVARSTGGTFLHSRRFLSYHGARFRDVSLLLREGADRLSAVLPAAVDPGDPACVTSHPGITYGGLVHDGRLVGARMIAGLRAIAAHYAAQGFGALRYKVVPSIYHRTPSQDDLYALFRLGATCYRRDLSSAVDLAGEPRFSARRRRGARKARQAGVEVSEGIEWTEPLWPVLEENLAAEHQVRPVHSAGEIRQLHAWFPDDISVVVARAGGAVIAGVVLFWSERVCHAQYIATSPAGRAAAALDLLLQHCIDRARRLGRRFFDFGISTEQAGQVLNDGLYTFKAEFGGGGVAHDFYELALGAP